MWDSWEDWDVSTEGEADELAEGGVPLLEHNFFVNFEDTGVDEVTVVINNVDLGLIEEWNHFELLEESGLVWSNYFTLLDDWDSTSDFDLVLVDLGIDLEGGEEGGGFWTETGDLWLDDNVVWGDHTSLGGSLTSGVSESLHDWLEITVGEDETDVKSDVLHKLLEFLILLVGEVTVDKGLLTEDEFSLTAKKTACSGKLVGSDVVDIDDKDLGVFLEESV